MNDTNVTPITPDNVDNALIDATSPASPMPEFETSLPVLGYAVPGPLPVLCRTAPKGAALELTAKAEADVRISWLAAKLAEADAAGASAYVIAKRSADLSQRCVDFLSRMHAVRKEWDAMQLSDAKALRAVFDILAEDAR